MKFPVFDLHCDTASALLGKSWRQCGSLKNNGGHVDLERASVLDSYAQCFACCTTTLENAISPVELFERQLASVMREVENNRDCIAIAYNASDVENNRKNGLMSAILSLEGPAAIGFDPGLLHDIYMVGYRMSTLGWNESNPLCGSHLTGEGLTEQGRQYMKTAQKLGMIVDMSHISDAAFWDAVNVTEKPLIASHSNSRSVFFHSRNLTDDMFRAICDTDGVVGINLYANFLGENPDLDTVCDHIFHFLELDPNASHICLGADLDGCDLLPDGFSGVQDYNKLSQRLLDRGLDQPTVMNIFWNNAFGVLKRCCM